MKSIPNSLQLQPNRLPLAGVALGLLAFSMGGCVDRAAQKQAKATAAIVSNPVQTVAAVVVKTKALSQNLDISGQVTTFEDSQVGAKTSGKIVAVYVRDGDHVAKGQIVAKQDATPLVAALNQAQSQVMTGQAGLASANSSLVQAIRNEQINPFRSTASVDSAEAALRSAKANLAKMLAGSRPQEKLQAEATLRSAKANLDVQKRQLDRITTLVQQGALAGSQQDTQEAAYESALATYENAKQSLDLVQVGNRQEDIDASRESVAQAEEAVKTAKATKSLDPLYQDQVEAARAAVVSAQATIRNAQAQVVIAQQALSDADIRAPFDGQVSGKPVEVGTIATPGSTVAHIIGSSGIYFEGNVPSDQIDQITVGMPVSVHIDSIGENDLPAKVAAISPEASAAGRLFTVRVQFTTAPAAIRPGMFATGSVQVKSIPDAIVVPAAAVQTQGSSQYVFLAVNDKAKKTPVTTGLEQGTDIQIVSGLKLGDNVIYQGQDRLTDGTAIHLQKGVNLARANTGSDTHA